MTDLRNKVTIDDLTALVDSGHTEYNHLAGTLTHCTITLPCGFQVTGESACIDPANYDQELGQEIARKKAVNALWPLEGYLLANDRYRAEQVEAERASDDDTYLGRMRKEFAVLDSNTTKLITFLSKPKPDFVSVYQWEAMQDQCKFMQSYREILNMRINNAMAEHL